MTIRLWKKNFNVLFLRDIKLSSDELRKSRRQTCWIFTINAVLWALAFAFFSGRQNKEAQIFCGFFFVLKAAAAVIIGLRARK